MNDSKVIALSNGLNQISLGGYPNASINAVVGQPYPVLYGTDIVRDPQGHAVVNASNGAPSLDPNLKNLGRTTPKYILGLTQTVSYKFLTLTLVSEYRSGYVIYNRGLYDATSAGVSEFSASTGRARFVFPNSVIQTAPDVYTPNTNVSIAEGNVGFWNSGAFYNAASSYVSSGAFWKLREANLNFDLSSLLKHSKFIKRASFCFSSRQELIDVQA
ncbi:hypothetical protein [Pedobacter sp. NJ-S-72]